MRGLMRNMTQLNLKDVTRKAVEITGRVYCASGNHMVRIETIVKSRGSLNTCATCNEKIQSYLKERNKPNA